MSLLVTRAAIATEIRRWQAGELDAAALLAWVRHRWPPPPGFTVDDEEAGLSVAREALAELDLLEVHLLLPEDAPALLELLAAPTGKGAGALVAWARHRASIDLAARSRRLKKDPFYRPFCK